MTRLTFVVAAMMLLIPGIASSQAYPSRPLRLIVPSAPGGSPDINARELANELTKQMGQQVVVENRAGASGILGYEVLARATPDGYTFAYISNFIATNPSLYAKLSYDFARDFRPVIFYFRGFNVLTVSPTLAVRSVKDLIDLARANPGKLTFGSSGIGATPHLSMELFKSMTDTAIVHVPYKGTQQAVTDLLGGQIDILCDNMGSLLPLVRAGRMRALAVTSLKRSAAIPELPTLDEAGLPGYELSGWSGLAVPAGTPRAIVLRLNAEINKALLSPAVTKGMASRGGIGVGGTPEEFADHVRKETERLGKLIKAVGIKPQ
ncbi:MAG: Bug family tripartite tricarboxylate transporter substrate binding protein [Burkholderiales bacterium]